MEASPLLCEAVGPQVAKRCANGSRGSLLPPDPGSPSRRKQRPPAGSGSCAHALRTGRV